MSYSDECLEAHNVYLDRMTSNMKNAHSIDKDWMPSLYETD